MKSQFRISVCIIFVFTFFHSPLFAQENIDSLLDDFLYGEEDIEELIQYTGKYQFLYAGSEFENRTLYRGQAQETDYFNTVAQLFYLHSSGITLGFAGILDGNHPNLYSTTFFSAGYSNKFKKMKGLRYRASANYMLYHPEDEFSTTNGVFGLSAGLSYRRKIFAAKLNYSVLPSISVSSRISADIQGDFTLFEFKNFDKISFEPEITFYFGGESVVYTDFTLSYLPQPTYTQNYFGMYNTELSLPINMTISNFDFEIGYNLNFARSLSQDSFLGLQSYFNISAGYFFNISTSRKASKDINNWFNEK